MGGYYFPAAQIGATAQTDLVGSMAKVLALRNEMQQRELVGQQIQSAQLDVQQKQMQLGYAKALNDAYSSGITKDPTTGAVSYDQSKVLEHLAANGAGSQIPSVQKAFLDMTKLQGEVQTQQNALRQNQVDYLGSVGSAIQSSGYDPHVAGALLAHAASAYPTEAGQVLQQFQKDPNSLKQIADSWVAQSTKQQELATQRMTAQGTLARGQAAAALAPSEQAKNEALTQEAQTRTTQMGQVTPAIRYEQQQANYRASLSRQAENQNAIGRAGLASLEKQGTEYTTFASQMQNLKTQLAAAKTGDEVANAFAPVASALGSNAFYGTHRVAPAEVQALGPQLGSLAREVNTWFDKNSTGTLPDASLKEFGALVDRLSDAKYQSYKQGTDYTITLHGLDNNTPVMDKTGATTTVGQRAKAPATAAPPPAPAKPNFKVTGLSVTDPGGHVHTFPSAAARDAFLAEVGK